jgi:CHAT domain-containing protein/tetratricopeptide (TPR) repeat protein
MRKKINYLLPIRLLIGLLAMLFVSCSSEPDEACLQLSDQLNDSLQVAERLFYNKNHQASLSMATWIRDTSKQEKCWVHYDEALALMIGNLALLGKENGTECEELWRDLQQADPLDGINVIRSLIYMAPFSETHFGADEYLGILGQGQNLMPRFAGQEHLDILFSLRPAQLRLQRGAIYFNKGGVAKGSGSSAEADENLDKAVELLRANYKWLEAFSDSLPPPQNWKDTVLFDKSIILQGATYSNLVAVSKEKEQFDSALVYVEKALSSWKRLKKRLPYSELADLYANQGLVHLKMKQYDEAETQLRKSISLFKDSIPNSPDRNIVLSPVYSWLAETLLEQGKLDASIQNSQLAYFHSSFYFPREAELYRIPIGADTLFMGPGLFIIMETHRRALAAKGTPEGIRAATQLGHELKLNMDETIWSFLDEGSTLFSSAYYKKACVWMLSQAIQRDQLFSLSRDSDTLASLIQLYEGAKASALFYAWRNNQLKQEKFEVPLKEELTLRKEIGPIEENFYYGKLENLKPKQELDSLYGVYLKVFEDYQSWKESLKQEFPAYYRLRFGLRPEQDSSLLQHALQDEQAVLAFVWGENQLYRLAAFGDTVATDALPVAELLPAILQFKQGVSNPVSSEDSLRQLGFFLYQQLIPPFLQKKIATQAINGLRLLPDGPLSTLPFAALQCQPGDDPNAYLGVKVPLSHAFSLALLKEFDKQADTDHRKARLLAVAPSFGEGDCVEKRADENGPLCYNDDAVKAVKRAGDKVLLGEKASLDRFLNELEDYPILQFSTHANIFFEDPNENYIAFSPENGKTQRWKRQDVLEANFSARLVTLSACQTALGSNTLSEGKLSMLRTFTQKGTPAIMATLWKVNDKSTQTFTESWYKHLRREKPLDQALQLALQELLESEARHPFFWAPFVLYGSRVPIRNW